MTQMTCIQATTAALAEEMARDPTIFHAGIDVAKVGGVFGGSVGLLDRFGPRRVRDTPISEAAIVAMAVGSALVGARPVIQLMFADFLMRAWDEIVNQAAKMHFMCGGSSTVPLTIMAGTGGGICAAAQHSQSIEAMCAHVPGLIVVCPSNPADCKGLLKSSIRDDNPVIFLDSKALGNLKGEVPDGEHLVPLGKAAVTRPGKDLTIVAVSRMVHLAHTAAEQLAGAGIDAEVIDPRTIYPLDTQTILESVARTGRLMVVHEASTFCGIGAEIVSTVTSEAFDSLKAAPVRLGSPHSPVPFAPVLENDFYPRVDDIVAAGKRLVA